MIIPTRAVCPSWQWFSDTLLKLIKKTAAGSACEDLRDSFIGQKHSAVDVCGGRQRPQEVPPQPVFTVKPSPSR